MGEFSITHWLVILVILLIFFGPSKLPQLGKSMGEAIRGFKKGLNTDEPGTTSTRPEQLTAAEQQKKQEALEKESNRS